MAGAIQRIGHAAVDVRAGDIALNADNPAACELVIATRLDTVQTAAGVCARYFFAARLPPIPERIPEVRFRTEGAGRRRLLGL